MITRALFAAFGAASFLVGYEVNPAILKIHVFNNSKTDTVCLNISEDYASAFSTKQCVAGQVAVPPSWFYSWEIPFVSGRTYKYDVIFNHEETPE